MEQLTQNSPCPICQSKSLKPVLDLKDYFLTGESFSLLECKQCTVRVTIPQPDPKQIFRYYASEEYVSHSDTKKGFINTAYQLVKNFTLNQKINLLRKFSPAQTILDYGCGTGDFLVKCQTNKTKCLGVEPDLEARKIAESKGLDVIPPDHLKTVSETFDAITMWHVLEHTYNPNATIQELKSRMSANGIMVIAVPNYRSHDAYFYKNHWAAYDVPRHLFHFTPKSMKLVAEKCGLKLIHQQGMFFDAFYVSMLSEKYKGNPSILGAWRGLISNYKAMNSLNYSSMIYILQKEAI